MKHTNLTKTFDTSLLCVVLRVSWFGSLYVHHCSDIALSSILPPPSLSPKWDNPSLLLLETTIEGIIVINKQSLSGVLWPRRIFSRIMWTARSTISTMNGAATKIRKKVQH